MGLQEQPVASGESLLQQLQLLQQILQTQQAQQVQTSDHQHNQLPAATIVSPTEPAHFSHHHLQGGGGEGGFITGSMLNQATAGRELESTAMAALSQQQQQGLSTVVVVDHQQQQHPLEPAPHRHGAGHPMASSVVLQLDQGGSGTSVGGGGRGGFQELQATRAQGNSGVGQHQIRLQQQQQQAVVMTRPLLESDPRQHVQASVNSQSQSQPSSSSPPPSSISIPTPIIQQQHGQQMFGGPNSEVFRHVL